LEGIGSKYRSVLGGSRQPAQAGIYLVWRKSGQSREGHTFDPFRQPGPAGYGGNASRHLKPGIDNHAITDHCPQLHQVAAGRVGGLHHSRRVIHLTDVARVVEMVENLTGIRHSGSRQSSVVRGPLQEELGARGWAVGAGGEQ